MIHRKLLSRIYFEQYIKDTSNTNINNFAVFNLFYETKVEQLNKNQLQFLGQKLTFLLKESNWLTVDDLEVVYCVDSYSFSEL